MKVSKIFVALLCIMVLFSAANVNAQTLSKQKKKELKKELKEYKKDPAKYQKMLKKNTKEKKELQDEIVRLKAISSDLREKNDLLGIQIDQLDVKYSELLNASEKTAMPGGVVYQVQMGYYEYLDLASFNKNLKMIRAEEVDNAKRYVVGYFTDVMDAVDFRDDIKILGVSDAFVSQYIDGERNMEFDAEELLKE